ncbi:hypothetical protein RhiirC2_799804 [Rhizophagus irregularis]|uniref:Uncharacterized protein n=1 Tax=Rhizophagus irregularis TaxID=588596 RepID=A0A2N1M4I9_9GLOM|nr:hypothetical protein RhiirC2_799804 [Rhizophagus irregularis]
MTEQSSLSDVKPRHFLGADHEDRIEAILSDREGYSLHEFIDGDEPLWPIIDFDLPREVYDSIKPKLTGKEVLDSLILAFRKICLEVAVFTELVRKKLPVALQANKIGEHICVKKAICPKDGSIFDFMIRPPNDESEIIENSPFLVIPKSESINHSSMGVDATILLCELKLRMLKYYGTDAKSELT